MMKLRKTEIPEKKPKEQVHIDKDGKKYYTAEEGRLLASQVKFSIFGNYPFYLAENLD